MKLSLVLATVATLVGNVVADGASIVSALDIISSEASTVESTLSSWPGDFLGALPITEQSAELLIGILNATAVAKASANLTDTETISVATATINLVTGTNSTVTAIIDAKPKFDHLLLSPVIYLSLQTLKAASDQLSAAITEKLPTVYQAVAEALSAELDDSFDTALDAYS